MRFTYSERVSKIIRFIVAGLFSFVLVLLCACGNATVTPTPTTQLPPGPQNSSLLNANINVAALTNQDYAFDVTPNMKDARIAGSFETFGGVPNSIQVFVMDDATYNSWIKGRTVPLLFSSGKMSFGDINVAIAVPGKYHLTFSNSFSESVAPAQQVKVNIDLEWTN